MTLAARGLCPPSCLWSLAMRSVKGSGLPTRRRADYILEMRAGQWRDRPALAFRAESASVCLLLNRGLKVLDTENGLETRKTGSKTVPRSSKDRIQLIRPKPALFHQSLL